MRLTIREDGKVKGVWVAKTRRGFNKQQRREILAVQLALKPAKLSQAETIALKASHVEWHTVETAPR
jgi:hypothetical protein